MAVGRRWFGDGLDTGQRTPLLDQQDKTEDEENMKIKLEKRLLDFVAAIAPWLAPLIPTYFAAYNAYEHLTKGKEWWDVAAGVIVALVVETIGLAGVHTAIQFWNWNRTKRKTDDAAPMGLAIVAVVVYVAIIITVNGILDYYAVADPGHLPYVRIAAVAMLSMLALNSALIVALRAGQQDREEKAEQAHQERKEQSAERKNHRKVSGDEGKVTGKFPGDWRRARPYMSREEVEEIARMSGPEIVRKYYLPEDGRKARDWRKYAIEEVRGDANSK